MITTIQLHEEVRNELDRLKDQEKKTYEDVILYLVKMQERIKRKQEELLIEGCKEMAEDSLKMCKDWETTDASLDWEW